MADPDGTTWEYRLPGSSFHHDSLRMPNGNLLLLAERIKTRDEAVAAGADPAFVPPQGIAYEAVVEVRPSRPSGGEIVWEWSLWDHLVQDFDPDRANYGDPADHPELVDLNFLLESLPAAAGEGILRRASDWIHANSIDYHPGLDRIAISARNFSELWIIDHGTTTEEAAGPAGDLLYRWGNPRAYRTGTAADQRLFWPHQVHWIEPGLPGAGNLLMFNNGMEFAGHARGWSSVVELAPPADGRGYRPVWTYEADPPAAFYSPTLSGAQRLPNGNTLIASGEEGTVFEVTPGGRTVWKYASGGAVYRATRYAPGHPGLASLLGPGLGDAAGPPDPADWYGAATAAEPRVRGPFNAYLDGRTLTYVREDCAPEDAEAPFFVHAYAASADDLPEDRRGAGFETLSIEFAERGVRLGESCTAAVALPDYALRSVRTGQYRYGEPGHLWDEEFALDAAPWLARFASFADREPDARRAGFELHLEGRTLTLVRGECEAADIADRFFVHAYPADGGGREAIDFRFRERGLRHGDRCMASVPLPDYPIARLAAGRYDGTGHLWEAALALPAGE